MSQRIGSRLRKWLTPGEMTAREWRQVLRWRFLVALTAVSLAPYIVLLLADLGVVKDTLVAPIVLCLQYLAPSFLSMACVAAWWARPTTRTVLGSLAATPTAPFHMVQAHFLPVRILLVTVCLPSVLVSALAVAHQLFGGLYYCCSPTMLALSALASLVGAWCNIALVLLLIRFFRSTAVWLLASVMALALLDTGCITLVFEGMRQWEKSRTDDVSILLPLALAIGLKLIAYMLALWLVPRCVNERARQWAQ